MLEIASDPSLSALLCPTSRECTTPLYGGRLRDNRRGAILTVRAGEDSSAQAERERMIRRYAAVFRLTLAAADTALALLVVVGATNFRFGRTSGWPPDVRTALPDPNLAVAVFVGMWIAVLWLHGLYRSRARWTRRGEIAVVLRATVVQLVLTLSLLYVFKLPDVSRLLLIVVFPSLAVAAIGIRIVGEAGPGLRPRPRPQRPLHAHPGRQCSGQGLRRPRRESCRAGPGRDRPPEGGASGARSRARPPHSRHARRSGADPAQPDRRRSGDLPAIRDGGADRAVRLPVRAGGQGRSDAHRPGGARC